MATAVPAVPAAPAAAPAAAPPTPAAPALGANAKVARALGVGDPQQQPPAPAPQRQAGETQAQQQSRLEALLATLPEGERGEYLQELNALKSGAARGRQAQSEAARFNQAAEAAEFNAIQAVRHGADPFAIAANLSQALGQQVDVSELVLAANEAGGPVGAGAAQSPSNTPVKPGGQSADAGADPQPSGPTDFQAVWQMHRAQADLNHPKSWTKPLLTARRDAQKQRDLANNLIVNATVEGKPVDQSLVDSYHAAADQIEARAEVDRDRRTAGMVNEAQKQIMSKLQPLLDKLDEVGKKDQQTAAVRAEWSAVGQAMQSARLPTGEPMFGPQGYDLMEVDAHGNCTVPHAAGQRVIDKATAWIAENGLQRNMKSMKLALDAIAAEYVLSDGAQAAPAGGQGGSDMLPPGGPTPGNGQYRPSPARVAAAGDSQGYY